MVWRWVLAALVLSLVARDAAANGRPPATSSITFRQGNDNDIVAGLTFGLVVSQDGGKSWSWMCESAVPIFGPYDPRYAFSSAGTVFATTMDGLRGMRDRCTFAKMPSGQKFVSATALGPDRAFYYASWQLPDAKLPADFQIYKSTDDGASFPTASKPGDPADTNVWWDSILVAPGDARRIYVSGYSYVPLTGGGTERKHLVFRSEDGGATWKEQPTAGFTLAQNAVISIVGVTGDDPGHLYARVAHDDNRLRSSLYRSTDAGATWTMIKQLPDDIPAFVVRAAKNAQGKHDLIYGTPTLGAEVSHDDGATWTPLASPPHMTCLAENAAGEIWACTQNYGFSQIPSDGAGIMKTTDLQTWTKVLRYQELSEAVTCPAGTPQHDTCAAMWCAVCQQLGCKPSASYGCPVQMDVDVPAPAPSGGGCCQTGQAESGGAGALALALAVGTVLLRRRRRPHA